MKDELISVVVPAYNCAPWLSECLESLLNQTYTNLEIIVVNDGSTDDTGNIMNEYREKDHRILCVHKENAGVTSARLRGVEESHGSWIGFVDGDDKLDNNMYEHLLFNANEYDADISHCGFQEVYPDGTIIMKHGTGVLIQQDSKTALQDLLEERIVEPSLCTKIFRRALFLNFKDKMDTSIKNNEDILMNFFLFSQARCAIFEDICLYHYMIHHGSASRRKLDNSIIYDPIRVRQIIVDTCKEDLQQDARRALVRMCLVSYRLLTVEKSEEYAYDRKKVREMIIQQLPYCDILSVRNAVLVKLISYTPWVFDMLYPPFEKLFRM